MKSPTAITLSIVLIGFLAVPVLGDIDVWWKSESPQALALEQSHYNRAHTKTEAVRAIFEENTSAMALPTSEELFCAKTAQTDIMAEYPENRVVPFLDAKPKSYRQISANNDVVGQRLYLPPEKCYLLVASSDRPETGAYRLDRRQQTALRGAGIPGFCAPTNQGPIIIGKINNHYTCFNADTDRQPLRPLAFSN